MKRYIKIIALLICAACFIKCTDLKIGSDFLERPPASDFNIDTAFSSSYYAERTVSAAYIGLPYGVPYGWAANQDKLGMDLLESLTDLCQSYLNWSCGAERHYYNGQYDAGKANMYDTKYAYNNEQSWQNIRKAYIVIGNIDRVPDMSDELKARRKAEAKMIIAVHYTEMFRHFGGLPLVDRAIYPGDNYYYPRETVENTVNFIVNLCDEAAADLEWSTSPEDDGRFTKAAAMALKIRVLLFAASPLFNDDAPYLEGEASSQLMTWYGDKQQSRWDRVVKACEEFVDAQNRLGVYELVNTGNPRQDFQDAWYKRANGEVLISTRVRYTCPDIWDGDFYFMQSAGVYGTSCPTTNYIDMFSNADGTPFSLDWDNLPAGANPFANRDIRLYETLLIPGDSYRGRTAETWVGGQDLNAMNKTGSAMRKFLLEMDNATLVGSVIHWPYMRLAEVYLSYAEALNEVGRTGEAYQWVEKVRSRVGLPAMDRNLSQTDFREMLLNERCCEFGYEEVRWFDIIRWKREADFRKTLYGLTIELDDPDTKSFKCTRWPIPDRYWKNAWSPKWYLGAFPSEEINKRQGLVQNPGW